MQFGAVGLAHTVITIENQSLLYKAALLRVTLSVLTSGCVVCVCAGGDRRKEQHAELQLQLESAQRQAAELQQLLQEKQLECADAGSSSREQAAATALLQQQQQSLEARLLDQAQQRGQEQQQWQQRLAAAAQQAGTRVSACDCDLVCMLLHKRQVGVVLRHETRTGRRRPEWRAPVNLHT
jgi:hypothetical protein